MIQPEPEGSTQGYPLVSVEVLRKTHTLVGNLIKEILLKLNLPDHRTLKDGGEVFHMAQQVIPAAQLVPRYHNIGRCNNYDVLQSITCSPECKIVGKILLDHPLSYALTATADFMLDTEEFTYIVDIFRVTLHLPMETPENPFVAPVNIQAIEAFMNRVGYQGVVDKKFPKIPQRIDEDYHSIKDDSPLEIHDTNDFKECETVFVGVDVQMNQPRLVVSTQGTHRNTPRAHRTPTVSTTKPESHKEHQKNVTDDDEEIEKEKNDEEIKKEKKDKDIEKEKNIDDVEKTDEVVKEKDIDVATGSMEFRKEKMQTPISLPTRSLRKVSYFDKTVSEELTASVSPTIATTSKDSSTSKRKKNSISYKMKILPKNITNKMINKEMPRLVNLVVNKDCEVDLMNAQEMISKEFSTHAPKLIEELFRKHIQHTNLNLYLTTSLTTDGKSMADLQQQLYLNMKLKPQDQAADLELWKF
nr:hypothetical protein [Tanacetum cinerariifolium]